MPTAPDNGQRSLGKLLRAVVAPSRLRPKMRRTKSALLERALLAPRKQGGACSPRIDIAFAASGGYFIAATGHCVDEVHRVAELRDGFHVLVQVSLVAGTLVRGWG
jgi:hypothetical protein